MMIMIAGMAATLALAAMPAVMLLTQVAIVYRRRRQK